KVRAIVRLCAPLSHRRPGKTKAARSRFFESANHFCAKASRSSWVRTQGARNVSDSMKGCGCICLNLVVSVMLLVPSTFAQSEPEQSTAKAVNNDAPPPTGVEVEIGILSRIGQDVSNYSSLNGVLSVTNIGRATPQLLTGLGFLICDPTAVAAHAFCKHY